MSLIPPNINNNNNNNIKDNSGSTFNLDFFGNKLKNLYLPPLQLSNNKIDVNQNNTILDISKKNIKTSDNELNMTINSILNNIDKNRKENKKSLYNIRNTLDTNFSDISNSQIVTYNNTNNLNSKESLDNFLNDITVKNNELNFKTSLFDYNNKNKFFPPGRHARRRSIYYKAPENKLEIPPTVILKKTKVNIQVEIDGLDDILKLINDYPLKVDVEYNIDMKSIHNIKKPLIELKNMIGMQKLKNCIVDQILYFIQDFHKFNNNNNDFMHTVIYGPPGTGKTETAKIIGKIFSNLGVLSKNYFKKVTRADLIAGYLGQTALKTKDVLNEAKGGVLFIDEAYALGNPEKRDSFAKECIDTLCEGLSDFKSDLMVIIAGYEEELKNCFFAYNQGLDSRFTWRFNTDDYKFNELFLIFKKKINDISWKLNEKVKDTWFENKMDYFKFYGRDIETLLAKVKIAHSRRVFCLSDDKKRIITLKDLNKGFNMFLDNNEVKERKCDKRELLNSMYL